MEIRRLNKKGFFFTVMVILMLALFIASFTLYEEAQNRKSIQKRIATMNNFIFTSEKDISRRVYVSSYRTIFLLEKQVTSNVEYVPNFDSLFQEAFFYGTLNGVPQDILIDPQVGTYYETIKEEVENSGNEINVNIELSDPELTITQTDPWNVKVTLTVNLKMTDNSNLAEWDKTSVIDAYIPITNFDDPLYYVSTGGYVNRFKQTPYTIFANNPLVTNLSSELTEGYYKASTAAPSFISRFKGEITNEDPYGIESFVNVQNLTQQGYGVTSKSIVDYIYFNSNLNPPHYAVNNMPSWFRIDQDHLDDYNITAGMYHS